LKDGKKLEKVEKGKKGEREVIFTRKTLTSGKGEKGIEERWKDERGKRLHERMTGSRWRGQEAANDSGSKKKQAHRNS